MTTKDLNEAINRDIGALGGRRSAVELVRIANRYFRYCPGPIEEMLDLIGSYLLDGFPKFAIATSWAKRRADLIDIAHFARVETWLFTCITGWWECDQFCYRILNPFVYSFPELYSRVLTWTAWENPYVRRAAPVSLIAVGPPNHVDYPADKVFDICTRLLGDEHIHVRKGVGWLLKCAYTTYPEQTVDYLESNAGSMSRTTYRYALGRMPKQLRTRLLKDPSGRAARE